MQILMSAIAAGGLVGAADQYLFLLLISAASKLGFIEVAPEMAFVESWVFIGIVAVFWIVTLLPAYSSLLAPGVMNTVNTISRFLSGFLVPLSSAIISLIAVGSIINIDPNLRIGLETLQIFDPNGFVGLSGAGQVVAGFGAMSGTAVMLTKAIAKPVVGTTTGTIGTTSAPIYATIENIATVVLMGLAYVLTEINPWLLVALGVLVIFLVVAVLVLALYQLWKLKKGIGRVFYLLQVHPKAGLAIVAEFLLWGSGWLAWRIWARGAVMLLLWGIALFVGLFVLLPVVTVFSGGLLLIPFVAVSAMLYIFVGLGSARALMRTLDELAPVDEVGCELSPTPMPSG